MLQNVLSYIVWVPYCNCLGKMYFLFFFTKWILIIKTKFQNISKQWFYFNNWHKMLNNVIFSIWNMPWDFFLRCVSTIVRLYPICPYIEDLNQKITNTFNREFKLIKAFVERNVTRTDIYQITKYSLIESCKRKLVTLF